MKVALLADTHFGARGDSPIFHTYFTRFFREIFFPYVDENNIGTVIHLGDLVDRRKFLTYSTANVMRKEYIEPSARRRLITYIIAGNHDCSYKNSNEINALREIIMGKEGFVIYSKPAEITLTDNLQVLMLPWIATDDEKLAFDMIRNSKADVVCAHLELAGFEMSRGQMMEHGMDAADFKHFKAVYSGHYHHKSSRGNIHYMGSPYEMTWADCDDTKGFHVLDTDTLELEFIPNPFTIHKRIALAANTDLRVLAGANDQMIKLVVGSGIDRDSTTYASIISELEKYAIDVQVIDEHLDIDTQKSQLIDIENVEDTMKIISDYIMATDTDVDKTLLVETIKELYMEVQHV